MWPHSFQMSRNTRAGDNRSCTFFPRESLDVYERRRRLGESQKIIEGTAGDKALLLTSLFIHPVGAIAAA